MFNSALTSFAGCASICRIQRRAARQNVQLASRLERGPSRTSRTVRIAQCTRGAAPGSHSGAAGLFASTSFNARNRKGNNGYEYGLGPPTALRPKGLRPHPAVRLQGRLRLQHARVRAWPCAGRDAVLRGLGVPGPQRAHSADDRHYHGRVQRLDLRDARRRHAALRRRVRVQRPRPAPGHRLHDELGLHLVSAARHRDLRAVDHQLRHLGVGQHHRLFVGQQVPARRLHVGGGAAQHLHARHPAAGHRHPRSAGRHGRAEAPPQLAVHHRHPWHRAHGDRAHHAQPHKLCGGVQLLHAEDDRHQGRLQRGARRRPRTPATRRRRRRGTSTSSRCRWPTGCSSGSPTLRTSAAR